MRPASGQSRFGVFSGPFTCAACGDASLAAATLGMSRPCGFSLSRALGLDPRWGHRAGSNAAWVDHASPQLVCLLAMFRYPPAGLAKPGRGFCWTPATLLGFAPFAVLILSAGLELLSQLTHPHMPFGRPYRLPAVLAGAGACSSCLAPFSIPALTAGIRSVFAPSCCTHLPTTRRCADRLLGFGLAGKRRWPGR